MHPKRFQVDINVRTVLEQFSPCARRDRAPVDRRHLYRTGHCVNLSWESKKGAVHDSKQAHTHPASWLMIALMSVTDDLMVAHHFHETGITGGSVEIFSEPIISAADYSPLRRLRILTLARWSIERRRSSSTNGVEWLLNLNILLPLSAAFIKNSKRRHSSALLTACQR